MGNSPAKLFTNYRELDRHNHAPKRFAISPGSSAVSPVLQPFTNSRNSSNLDSCRIGRISSYIEQIRGIPRIRGEFGLFEGSGKCTTECSGACTSRFALLLQYQDITSRPVEHTRYNSSRKRPQLNQPAAASGAGRTRRKRRRDTAHRCQTARNINFLSEDKRFLSSGEIASYPEGGNSRRSAGARQIRQKFQGLLAYRSGCEMEIHCFRVPQAAREGNTANAVVHASKNFPTYDQACQPPPTSDNF